MNTYLRLSIIAAALALSGIPTVAAEDMQVTRRFCNFANRDPLQAIDNCTKLLESPDPTDKRNAYTNRGRGFLVHGWLDKALADFNEALRLDPKSAMAYNNRAVAYRALGRFQEALADHDRALAMEKNNDLFIRARENTLKKMGTAQ